MTETTSPVSRGCTACGRLITPGSRYFIDCTEATIKRLCRGCAPAISDPRRVPTASTP